MKNFAVSVWFKVTSGSSNNTSRNIVQLIEPQNRNYTVTYNYSTSKIDYYNYNGLTTTTNIFSQVLTNISPNAWYHLVLRVDIGKSYRYVHKQ
jgi:hypothetical protein